MVKELIEAGAQIDNKNEDEQTPLHIAASEGRLNIVQCILSYDRYSVNDEDFESQTALHLASTKVEPFYYFAILNFGILQVLVFFKIEVYHKAKSLLTELLSQQSGTTENIFINLNVGSSRCGV